MKKIVFYNAKGGTGKTTLSILYALMMKDSELNVALLDLDPQKTAENFIGMMEDSGIRLYNEKDKNSYDILVIDTPPQLAHNKTLEELKNADRIVVVTTPSPADITTTKQTVEMLKKAKLDKKTIVLVNKAQKKTTLTKSFDSSLLDAAMLKNMLPLKQSYQHMLLEGLKNLTPEAKNEAARIFIELQNKI